MANIIIRLEDIFKIYGSGAIEVKALNDVNLTFKKENIARLWDLAVRVSLLL